MDNYKKLFAFIKLFFVLTLIISCNKIEKSDSSVIVGADLLISENYDLIKNKTIGIVTNHTAILSNGVHLVDTLYSRNDINIKCLFGPEHGIRGDAPDGESIKNGNDYKTGLPVYSLYGKIRKPSKVMLNEIDVLLFDIQDIGARFYTFISTMYYTIQSAAENKVPIIILDRPNPINGTNIDGAVLNQDFKSFVGIAQIPIRHGMTVGELALFFNRKEILETERIADLKIVKIKNWQRNMFFDDTKLPWIKPSPNMPDLETALVYPGMCLLEGTNISEGRGTFSPFLNFGSPYIDSKKVINEMNSSLLEGFELYPITFIPEEIENMSMSPKYKNIECKGIELKVIDRNIFNPIEFSITLIYTLNKLYPHKFTFRENWIDKLWGNSSLREFIKQGKTPLMIIEEYQKKLIKFKEDRKQFLLY